MSFPSGQSSLFEVKEAATNTLTMWDDSLEDAIFEYGEYDAIQPSDNSSILERNPINVSASTALPFQLEAENSHKAAKAFREIIHPPEPTHASSGDSSNEPLAISPLSLPLVDECMTDAVLSYADSDSSATLCEASEHSSVINATSSKSRSCSPVPRSGSQLVVAVPKLLLSLPESHYEPFHPSAPQKSEIESLKELHSFVSSGQDTLSTFIEIQLNDFSIYHVKKANTAEMRCLHHLDTKRGYNDFYFDGILSAGSKRYYVNKVPISTVPIGNYGAENSHTVRDSIWLQSRHCEGSNLYYKLGEPSAGYRRFFEPFFWIADLAKHFVDFLASMSEGGTRVSIRHFRNAFKDWLVTVHGNFVIHWLNEHPSGDFRTAVVANVAFLYKESTSVLGQKGAYFHSLWAEIWDLDRYSIQSLTPSSPTVVTEYTLELFSHLPFGPWLQAYPLSPKSSLLRDQVNRSAYLERCIKSTARTHTTSVSIACDLAPQRKSIPDIRPGDTISTCRDSKGSGSLWDFETAHGFADADRWFALVQAVRTNKRGAKDLEVIWYYRPVDTICGLMRYPWPNELFLSDHCSCHEKVKIQEHEVLGLHEVEFGGNSATQQEFFCRQVYHSADRKWQSLQDCHLRCSHHKPNWGNVETYQAGETYLIQIHRGDSRCEPCELVRHHSEHDRPLFQFRRLLRRNEADAAAQTARCNELVYSHRLVTCRVDRIVGRCQVRFFRSGEDIPTPYDRGGVGCFFYITHQETLGPDESSRFVPLQCAPESLKQGFDPTVDIAKLRGLDLFCGGGNFGRGLEEGGAIQMNWANDYDITAMHTYMANCENTHLTSPFLGPIDKLHQLASDGLFSQAVPRIGEVDFISAGSPCPGFSKITNDRTTSQQRKNQSMIAAFASFVDLYRPKYGILENVPSIIQPKASRDQDVFSQLICAIVGLGYQAQFFLLDASSQGSAQRRTRVFLTFAAPGFKLPDRPLQSHSHPPGTKEQRLGRLPTGDAIAQRELPNATPFAFVNFVQATRDLPRIYDGQADTCIPFPDHRVVGLTRTLKTRVSLIPKRPWGMNFRKARDRVLTRSEEVQFPVSRTSKMHQNTNCFGRMYPHALMETIITKMDPGCHKIGRTLHWDEDRPITVMEARRGQGFPDHEVILGVPSTQFKIVGNSVAREVALALGLAFRDAWVASRGGTEPFIRTSPDSGTVPAVHMECRSFGVSDVPARTATSIVVAIPSSSHGRLATHTPKACEE